MRSSYGFLFIDNLNTLFNEGFGTKDTGNLISLVDRITSGKGM